MTLDHVTLVRIQVGQSATAGERGSCGQERESEELYERVFSVSAPEDWERKGQTDGVSLKCPYAKDCKVDLQVDLQKEAAWSPAFGDPDSDVMVVAEAPSAGGGRGAHIGGQTRDWRKDEKGGVGEFLHFVRDHFGSFPHFTDVMKCGIAVQTRERKKEVFKLRTKNCEDYLVKEISVVNSKRILCVGTTAWNALKDLSDAGEN